MEIFLAPLEEHVLELCVVRDGGWNDVVDELEILLSSWSERDVSLEQTDTCDGDRETDRMFARCPLDDAAGIDVLDLRDDAVLGNVLSAPVAD